MALHPPGPVGKASAGERPTCARKRRIKRRAARISIAAYLRARALGGSRWPLDDPQRNGFRPAKTSMRASGLPTLDVRARVGRSERTLVLGPARDSTGPFYFFVPSHFGLNWCMAGCAWVETKTHFQSKYFTT